MNQEDQKQKYKGRSIPWLSVVRFHKEVVKRAEDSFFSLNGNEAQDERWTSLSQFEMNDMAGPWNLSRNQIVSQPFRQANQQKKHESLFLGGPCYVGSEKNGSNRWIDRLQPILYREVELISTDDNYEIVPKSGCWNLTPLLIRKIDRKEIDLGFSLDELAEHLIEKAAQYKKAEMISYDTAILRSFFSIVPELESALTRKSLQQAFNTKPSSWVLFAPTNIFSAINRYLMSDYVKLESKLSKNPTLIGGLKLLEDIPTPHKSKTIDVLPVVPLNNSQERAVTRILEQHPLTVISGPPGTGKSQVVVSVLLNAWASGQTVLFASNNNKAVDVVRERVEHFESEFPIAVRAGSRRTNNILEILRRTLNMAIKTEEGANDAQLQQKLSNKKKKLLDEKARLKDTLDSQLPQRIDESIKTALNAYGKYRSTKAKLIQEKETLHTQKKNLGYDNISAQELQTIYANTKEWMDNIGQYKETITNDNRERNKLEELIKDKEHIRNLSLEEIGFNTEQKSDFNWLVSGNSAAVLSDWEQKIRDFLSKPIEKEIEAVEWHSGYERWNSEEEAKSYALGVRNFIDDIRNTLEEVTPKLKEFNDLSALIERTRSNLDSYGIRDDIKISNDIISRWLSFYIEYTTNEKKWYDIIPFSHISRLCKKLRLTEREFRTCLPLEVWDKVKILNDAGREQLAPILEAIKKWNNIYDKRVQFDDINQFINEKFSKLYLSATQLNISNLPDDQQKEAWIRISKQSESEVSLADKATIAWKKRTIKEKTEERVRSLSNDFNRLCRGNPLCEVWKLGQGSTFYEAVVNLYQSPNPQIVTIMRTMLYNGNLSKLIECWKEATEHQYSIKKLNTQLANIPQESERIQSWWREKPKKTFNVESESTTEWPDSESFSSFMVSIMQWLDDWNSFENTIMPELEDKTQEELKWATTKLEQAIRILPDCSDKTKVKEVFSIIENQPDYEWPLKDLKEAFEAFNPDKIKAGIERIDVILEKASFEDAKTQWLQRLKTDDEAIRAVDSLEKSIRLNSGEVVEEQYDNFRKALKAVPIWITVGQSPQAIPLDAELFDIVIIDEASQCTLTNLLPLMYRGRSMAIIGDNNQLPAIPTIRQTEELSIASKYKIEEYLPLIGHAENDVYSSATESLPRRRADVLLLQEHFRSNPQIIGFSNRHIYHRSLEIKKDPSREQSLPFGNGVHLVNVSGFATRGNYNNSWKNQAEADAVIQKIAELKQNDTRFLSIGVVTPFSAQKEYLNRCVDRMGLSSEILVDTAHGFQGDERDIMIFSPVVAKGILSSSCRWVESPPNLINVAVTRAREALFVVCDLDFCLKQEGILRKLALYCKDIDLLRKTSVAELELFSWMIVKAWEPKVHSRIGDIEVDFVLKTISGVNLAIEVDGKEHHSSTVEKDKARDAFLQGRGYNVLRIPAREILETPFEVIRKIEAEMNQ